MSSPLVVTRHPALLAYLVEAGIVPVGTQAIVHATPDNVRGRRVIGVLPHHLSSLCSSVVEVPMNIPAELRGLELSLEQVRQYAGAPVEYVVRRAERVDALVSELPTELCRLATRPTGPLQVADAARQALQGFRLGD